jgi:hypothetical protein
VGHPDRSRAKAPAPGDLQAPPPDGGPERRSQTQGAIETWFGRAKNQVSEPWYLVNHGPSLKTNEMRVLVRARFQHAQTARPRESQALYQHSGARLGLEDFKQHEQILSTDVSKSDSGLQFREHALICFNTWGLGFNPPG